MCGIAGLFDMRGRRDFAPGLLQRMSDALAHRGPDGDGFYHDAGVGFGHRRLAIIDLAGGKQPMSLADGSATITYNGEIYNYRELRSELASRGARFQTHSDTECLLEGWRVWGPDLLARLNGQFAFAIWDKREECLFLARDRLGKKPLHYALLPDGTFAFASEIKSLMRHPEVSRTLDEEAIDDFFAYGYVPDPKTIFKQVRKLPPAHMLTLRRGQPSDPKRYWNLAEAAKNLRESPGSEAELRDRLARAVELRLVSDVEIGAFLSGGVDSSAVVALMAKAAKTKINTFSIGFSEKRFDESEYADAVARRYRTNHTKRTVTADGTGLLSRLTEIFDEPFGDSSAIPTFFVCEETAKFLKVCLSGDGGDEAFAGYRRYAFHVKEAAIRAMMPRALRRSLFGLAGALYPKLDWAPRHLRAKTTFQELSLDEPEAYFRIVAQLPDDVRRPLYSGDFTRRLGAYEPQEIMRERFREAEGFDALQRAQYADVGLYLPGDILVKVDRTSMANSLEVRAPFLDHEFIAWAFALPPAQKIDPRGGKALLKRAMKPMLDEDLLYRPKQGFSIPLSDWMRGPLKEVIADLPQSPSLQSCGLFDMKEIAARVGAHLSGLRDHSKSLWLILVFEKFLGHSERQGDTASSAERFETSLS